MKQIHLGHIFSQHVSRYLATSLMSRNSNSREHNFKVKHDFELTHSSMLMLTKKPDFNGWDVPNPYPRI